uniref:Uncharacterized protein n=1 Tax=Arion vulgaris TaxID=1028688 RepID=A0A0B7A4L4_9EUPU
MYCYFSKLARLLEDVPVLTNVSHLATYISTPKTSHHVMLSMSIEGLSFH